MPRSSALPSILLMTAITAAIAVLTWNERWLADRGYEWLWSMEAKVTDALISKRVTIEPHPSLVFMAIDEASLTIDSNADVGALISREPIDEKSRRALSLMSSQWPWSRDVHALVLEKLAAAGAKVVIFDLRFPVASENDEAFRLELEANEPRVVVAGGLSDELELKFMAPADSLIPEKEPRDERVGFDNWWPDFDDTIRHTRYRWAQVHGVWESHEELSLAARALQKAGMSGLIPAGRGDLRLCFAGRPGTFPARSIHGLFLPSYWRDNYGNGEFFRDKFVIVGAAGAWQHDEHPTPFGLMAGAELQLNALNAALQSAFLAELPRAMQLALIAVAGAIAWLASHRLRQPYLRLLFLMLTTCAWLAMAYLLARHAEILLPCVPPLLTLVTCGILSLGLDIRSTRTEKNRMRGALERYVSRNVVDELVADSTEYSRSLGGAMRPVTILFSDIRGFSRVAAHLDSHELVADLNEYFSAMVDCVFRHGGTLDKFIGDAVMAVWGNVRSDGPVEDAQAAVECAMAMKDALARLNFERAERGKEPLRMGVGLNHGDVIVGNIGSPSRMEFTVIGDAVNMAWRVQELTKLTGDDILLGVPLRDKLVGIFRMGPIETQELPGQGMFSFVRLLRADEPSGIFPPMRPAGSDSPRHAPSR